MSNYINDIVFIILGFCIVIGRKRISDIFTKSALKYGTKYNKPQEKVLFFIIWTIGLVFIIGGVYSIIKNLI